ncbi:MAG: Alpha/Beta hydrolase protein [Linnemannia gamsii]|nr:MAG: Alpha/Beta hydrolase protein [Linnemannia gamsii]
MPFTQPTGVSLTGSRGNLANTSSSSITQTAPSFISNNSTTSVPTTRKKFEPEKLCQVRNQWVRSADDSIHVFTKTWQPLGTPVISVVVFVHDIMEHCERYQPLFVQFAARGIEVQALDLPGFGETGAREDAYGITGGYDVLLKEIDIAIDRAQDSHPTKPIFLMGHGMGGALALNYVCGLGQRTPLLAGVISSSPYLKPTISGAGTRFPSTYNRLGKWYPGVSIGFKVLAEELTRDACERDRFLEDGLIRDSVSLQCLGDMIYQGQKILKKRWKKFPPPLPTLLLHGTDDPICSYQATHLLSSQLLKLEPRSFIFKSWKGSMHDPHWDLDAHAVRSEFTSWIRSNCKHFDKLPLEPSMVHWDSIRSSRSVASSRSTHSNSHSTSPSSDGDSSKKCSKKKWGSGGSSKEDKKREKKEKEERKKAEKAEKTKKKKQKLTGGSMVAGGNVGKQDGTQVESGEGIDVMTLPKAISNPANAEPEAIQDLEGLRRQQEMSKIKAIEKRREYNLEPPAPEEALEEQQQQQSQQPQQPREQKGLSESEPAATAPQEPEPLTNEQGSPPTMVVTEACSPSTTIAPSQPLPTIQSAVMTAEQNDDTGAAVSQSNILYPIVKEQTEMEKSLEVIALTLSRENSLNNLPQAAPAAAAVMSTSAPALGETMTTAPSTSSLEVEPIVVCNTSATPPAVDIQEEQVNNDNNNTNTNNSTINSIVLQPPSTNTEEFADLAPLVSTEVPILLPAPAEEIVRQEQDHTHFTKMTADPVVFADDTLVQTTTTTTLSAPAVPLSELSQSMPSLTTATSLPEQFLAIPSAHAA